MIKKNGNVRLEDTLVLPRGATILLVGEDRGELDNCGSILQERGYQVRRCESYEHGTRLLDSEPFDFIIVVQGTPNFEGRCVLERANQTDRHLPVVVVARYVDMPCYLEAMQLWAVDYLAQPVSVYELARVVKTHLPLHRAIRGAETQCAQPSA